MTASSNAAGRWLFGPIPDLLLGCGLWYMAFFAFFAVAGPGLMEAQPRFLVPLLMVSLSLPHYGATLTRVYEHRNSRRRYAIFAVWATGALLAFFVVGLYDFFVGSLLLTIYLTWSPWHYTGQNYGLAVLFLRRAGAPVSPGVKKLLYASFVISYAMVFTAFHADRGTGALQYAASDFGEATIRFLPLGIPLPVTNLLFALLASAYVSVLVVLARTLLRSTSARDLTPVGMLVLSQALWFTIPIAFSYAGVRTGVDPIDSYFRNQNYVFLVALGHAVQYLWITTYYARMSEDWSGYTPYLGKIFLAGVAIWTLPLLLFSGDLLGPTSYASGLAVLAASTVNVHHFILDGAIWKLRDGPIARVLLRQPVSDAAAEIGSERGVSWVRRGVWAFLACWVLLQGLSILEYEFGARPALRSRPIDTERLATSVERLRWIGGDDPALRFQLGAAAGERGDLAEARREFERSNELQENPKARIGLAFVAIEEGLLDEARDHLEKTLQAFPTDAEAWSRAAQAWRALGDGARADAALVRAAELASGGQDPSAVAPGKDETERSARNM